ncbi:hypothetical protein G6F46_013342 [Rhizopus delemar]|uniref:Uncharacterized protein n=2 Tax=Rhizopus TaxID=4842 RepID=A0A9P6YF94_9FUNG|nr:hypothetical protein G6F55_013355 [Rhizopus delemar]KAG1531487.1 hypothetical protein G6F51_013505 [Rhizopus arrhizus]KAG1485839.1 hypothetical protein G6F54_013318 [Rhizopus delemar]KAG1489697.1 hypothetical protein G6F53_013376 [Rhizopus delemar]KAG1493649.1 hypothetical protein G6F52_013227 [Rhizopus delemar]
MDSQYSSTGIPHSAIVKTSASITSPTPFPQPPGVFNFNIASYRTRSRNALTKTRHRAGSGLQARFPIQSFHHSEERWGSAPGTQPEATESASDNTTLQDGNNENHHTSATTRRLFDIHRFKRCLPPCNNSSNLPAPSTLSMVSTSISIPSFTFRAQPVAFDIHQGPCHVLTCQ